MSESKPKLQKYSAPALEKGLDILEFLSLTDAAPSLSQLAAGISRSKSEIFRMMIVLEERGYIERINGDQYFLTDRVAVLGAKRPLNNKLAELATPILQDLSEKTRYSCHLSALDGRDFVVVAQATQITSYGVSVQVGHRSEVVGTSAGACLMGFMQASEQIKATVILTEQDQHMNAGFKKKILKCHSDGYILMQSLETESISELSAPVLHSSNMGIVAVITIPHLTTDSINNNRVEVIDSLLSAATVLRDRIAITTPNLSLPTLGG